MRILILITFVVITFTSALFLNSKTGNAPKGLCAEIKSNPSMRFIAHGAGLAERNIYTNSLEALEASYKKGFRLIEIDLLKTTDNELVGLHSWEEYWGDLGQSNNVPVDHKIFMSKKIKGLFTPLDSKKINEFFLKNEDAYLLTDKIQDAQLVSEKLRFKDRIYIEVFSIENMKKALELGFKVIPSFTYYKLDQIEKIYKEFNVDTFAVSITDLPREKWRHSLFGINRTPEICMLGFTVNSDERFEELVVRRKLIDAVYTDFMMPEVGTSSCIESECRDY